ncbi:hypothetical protein [Vibrio mediterranei]|uniref:hypothetical protein n=1 Tax=Vibrio mediterranei TaxID=689 RepID=UPI00406771E4
MNTTPVEQIKFVGESLVNNLYYVLNDITSSPVLFICTFIALVLAYPHFNAILMSTLRCALWLSERFKR